MKVAFTLALIALCILSVLLVKTRRANTSLLQAGRDAALTQSNLARALEEASGHERDADLLRADIAKLHEELEETRSALNQATATTATPPTAERVPAPWELAQSPVGLTREDLDLSSLRVGGQGPAALSVLFAGKSTNEAEAIYRNRWGSLILGHRISSNGFGQVISADGSNGISLLFRTPQEAEAVAAELRGQSTGR